MTSLLERSLYDYDMTALNVDEDYVVNSDNQLRVEHYVAGRCHLAALVLEKAAGLRLGVFIENEPWLDDGSIGHPALEHAFCYLDGQPEYLIDARGIRAREDLLDEFCSNTNELVELRDDQAKDLLDTWLAQGLLEAYLPGEQLALASYFQEMQALGLVSHAALDPELTGLSEADDENYPGPSFF
jgi:hypothetical protein